LVRIRSFGVFVAAMGVLLATGASQAQTYFRMEVPELGGGPSVIEVKDNDTTAGGLSIVLPDPLGVRAGEDLAIPVEITGVAAGESLRISGLPDGAILSGELSSDPGTLRRLIDYPDAVPGDYALRVELLRQFGTLRAYRDAMLSVVGPLAVSLDQLTYETPSGTDIVVRPQIDNVLYGSRGRVAWSASTALPSWLSLDDSSGRLAVDASAMNRIDGLVLTAIDQGDHAMAATPEISIVVQGVLDAGDFTDQTDVEPGTALTSDAISFSGFYGTRTLTASGAQVLVNGVEVTPPVAIAAGDQVSLRATAPADPEAFMTASVSVDTLQRDWSIATRGRTQAALSISPAVSAAMWADGESGTAYSPSHSFTISNNGEDVARIDTANLVNPDHFELVSDACTGVELALNQSCSVSVRAKATSTGMFSGGLTLSGRSEYYDAPVSVAASLSGDALFPVQLSAGTNVVLSSLSAFQENDRWAAARPKRVVVPAGVIIGSNDPTVAALRSGTGNGGSLTLTVNGEIQGAGGRPDGGAGGTAILAETAMAVVNNGAIRAGGGAGGRGGNGGAGSTTTTVREPASGDMWSVYGAPYYYVSSSTYPSKTGGTAMVWAGSVIWSSGSYNPPASVTVGNATYYIGDFRTSGRTGGSDDPEYVSSNGIYRINTTSTPSIGGIASSAGRGQGYDATATNGAAAVPGGANAGASGRSGNGAAWGEKGQDGAAGTAGNNGSGAAGQTGGLAGWGIQNSGSVQYSGEGILQSR